MKNKKSQFKDTAKLKNIIFYIFAFVIFFVPLIVKIKVFTVPDYVSTYYPEGKTFDSFTYWKAMLLMVGMAILFPLVVYYRHTIGRKTKFDIVAKLHLGFGVSILLSTLLSSYKQVAFFGFFNKNEGALTWWAYLLLSYSIYLFIESKEEVIKFVKVIVASTTAICVVGLFQYIGLDYIKFIWFQKFFFGQYYEQIKESGVSMMFADRTVYSTVANPNYIGSIMAVAIPLLIYLIKETKNRRAKAILAALLALHSFILVASKSTAGLLAVSITVVVYGIYKLVIKKHYRILVAGVSGTIILVGIFSYFGLIDSQIEKVKGLFDFNQATVNPLKKIEVEDTRLKFTNQAGDSITVNHNGETVWVEDEKGIILSVWKSENAPIYSDNNWKVSYQPKVNILSVAIRIPKTGDEYLRQVFLTRDGYTSAGNNIDNKQLNVKKVNLFKNESLLTERGYIWNRTIPLIMDKPLFGYGADNFVLAFPQNDLLSKPKYNQLTDKSHNLLLQLGFNFGVLGLSIFAAMIYFSVKGKNCVELNLVLLAYMIAGVANDSTVFTSFLFFSVLGILYSEHSNNLV